MKKNKIIPLILSLAMGLSACGGSNSGTDAKTTGEGVGKGNKGDITATVDFDGDKIKSIETVHSETEGLGDQAIEKLTDEVVANNSVKVDTVSGATNSSVGFLEAVTAAIAWKRC